jgi:putative nucleotidyltransferase with HDIG domain
VNRPLSGWCRAYAVSIGLLGLLPLGWSLWTLAQQPPHGTWYLLAAITLISGPLSIRIPSMQATISVSEGFIFASALLFGPAAATATVAIDGMVVSLWSARRSGLRVLFGIGEPAISVCVASLLFYKLAGIPPLLHQAIPFAPLVLPLVVMTLAYFAINTLLAGTAVWLDTGGDLLPLLRRHVPHVALDFGVSMALAAALVQTNGNLTLSAVVILVPMLFASYISSHHSAGRLEDTNRHLAELRRLYDSTVETLAMAIDAKDQVTHGHIRRVQQLSTRLARALDASAADLQALEAAALLHDLGKLAVPEHILNKPGRLTPAEYEEMKKHADIGASILSAIDFPFPVVPIVRHHHENWDGSGYPDGLKGAAIPLGARILAVVDCYDALTSDRPYRRRMRHDEAIDIVESRKGKMYDPAVVEMFVRLHVAGEMDTESSHEGLPSPIRDRLTRAFEISPPPVSPRRPQTLKHAGRVTQFLTSLAGAGWDDAARAVATFIPVAVPDSVAVLFQPDPQAHQLMVVGLDRDLDARIPATILIGHGVSGWVAANKRTMANADAELDLGDIAGITTPPLRMCVSAPVVEGGALLAVLTVYSPFAFSETNQMLIEAIARELPLAIESGRRSQLCVGVTR